MAYFERNFVFYNRAQLQAEVISHYTKQFVKQLYVLVFISPLVNVCMCGLMRRIQVLGLDIIGNPFGLVRDLTSGVETLFYEPFQVTSSLP